MLPRQYRLPTLARAVFSGQRYSLKNFSLIIRANNISHARVGFIVSKKVSPKATRRNLLRRQLAHAFLQTPLSLSSQDYLIIAKPSALHLSFNELVSQLSSKEA